MSMISSGEVALQASTRYNYSIFVLIIIESQKVDYLCLILEIHAINQTAVEVRAWMSNYITQNITDSVTYPWPKLI